MYKIILRGRDSTLRWGFAKRFFLSNAYKCEEVWANRLKSSCFQKIDPSTLYSELEVRFMKNIRVSSLDVDLFINGVNNESFKNEMTDVLLQFRLCPESSLMPERTIHAAIRWYMNNSPPEELLNMLSDRISYGLFPDYYLTNMLMDKYLKEKDAVSAVKIAALQMLQEDFDHPIMKMLALYCCYNYLESPEIWPSYVEPEPNPDEETERVRVQFLRNPYFDDHFDITDTNHLVGKTLWLFGRTVDEPIGTSSQLLGLVLYEKYEKCAGFLDKVVRDGVKVHEEAVTKAREYCLKRPKQKEENNEKEEAKVESVDEWKTKVLDLLEKIDKKNLVKGNLLSESAELVKKAVKENESNDIKRQCEIYKQWEKERQDNIQSEIQIAELEQVKSEIEKVKDELRDEEERLFFFDNEEEHLMVAEIKEKEMQSVVYYKGKGKHKDSQEEDYIPPDVSQRKK